MPLYADQAHDILFELAKARHVCVSRLDVNLQKFQGKLKKLQNLQVLPRRVVAKVGKVDLPDCPAAPSTVPHNCLQRIQNHKGGPIYTREVHPKDKYLSTAHIEDVTLLVKILIV